VSDPASRNPPVKPPVFLIVDDHPLIRSALREALSVMAEGVELLEAENPEEGLDLLGRRADTDLIVLDLNFSQHDGLKFIEKFRAAAPAVPLVIYTMHEDAPTLRQALAFGAAGVIPKTHTKKLLLKAVELVIEGGIYIPPSLARQLADSEAAPAPAKASEISPQQWKILELLAEGFPNKEIARKLGIASSTVKNQLTAIFERLGVSNRTQAAIVARALVDASRGKSLRS
jgi:DNA-binding NarL/FixJ family response regulator